MSEVHCTTCGATHGAAGKPFTQKSKWQHVKDKHPEVWEARQERRRAKRKRYEVRKRARNDAIYQEFPVLEMADMLGDDLPDGAYWALVEEMGGI